MRQIFLTVDRAMVALWWIVGGTIALVVSLKLALEFNEQTFASHIAFWTVILWGLATFIFGWFKGMQLLIKRDKA